MTSRLDAALRYRPAGAALERTPDHRRCPRCKQHLPLTWFPSNAKRCRPCLLRQYFDEQARYGHRNQPAPAVAAPAPATKQPPPRPVQVLAPPPLTEDEQLDQLWEQLGGRLKRPQQEEFWRCWARSHEEGLAYLRRLADEKGAKPC